MENLEFKGTKNWRIRYYDSNDADSFFFVEADLPNAEENNHHPRLEVMQEDFGDHNGYTREMRLSDGKLIVEAENVANETGLTPR